MIERFKEIFKHTLHWEGGDKLTNIIGDAGGWTKYGISYEKNKVHFDSLEDFKAMTYETACEIAYQDYCEAIHLDLVNPEAQAMYFDISYNCGPTAAIKMAQRALNLTDDGRLGKVTKAALKVLNKAKLYEQRVNYYNAIVKAKPLQQKFLTGWINRSNYFLTTDI